MSTNSISVHSSKMDSQRSVMTSGKHSPLLGKQKRCHGLAYPSFTTYCCKLYRRMREGKVQTAWAHVAGWCEFRMIRKGYCLLFLSKVSLPTCGYQDLRYFLRSACSVPTWNQNLDYTFTLFFSLFHFNWRTECLSVVHKNVNLQTAIWKVKSWQFQD